MSTRDLPIPVELQRLRYRPGQELRSQDFRDGLGMEAQLRWWHVRAKHDAYGIAEGLSVAVATEPGGELFVQVAPGLAFDCFGRELRVCEPRTFHLSIDLEIGGHTTLLLRATGPSKQGRDNTSGVLCADPCAPDYLEAELVWDLSSVLDTRAGVPLARVQRGDDPRWRTERFSFTSRPAARPRVARGETILGSTPWQHWEKDQWFGMQTAINTAPAGFTRTPHYFANLKGSPACDQFSPEHFAATPASTDYLMKIVPLCVGHAALEAPDRFVYRIAMPLVWPDENQLVDIQRLFRRTTAVCWLGIEAQPSSPKSNGGLHGPV